MKIGFVGLGIMGESMSENIVKKHDDEVYVFDFVKEKVELLESKGAIGCSSSLKLAEKSDVIISMVPKSEHGFYSIYGQRQRDTKEKSSWKSMLLLIGAGIVHGMFVSGGPLLIGYLSNEIKEKTSFRATISTVWIILNSMILVQDICAGMWNAGLVMTQCISIPFLIAGMAAGSVLVKRMSQEIFMKLTYILLFISGILLMVK